MITDSTRSRFGALIWVVVLLGLSSWTSQGQADGDGGGSDGAFGHTVREAAEQLYNATNLTITQVYDLWFSEAFSKFSLYGVWEDDGIPRTAHRMAWNPVTETAYDVTKEFNTLLTVEGALIDSASKALLFGKAFAQTANPEFQPWRALVQASDSDYLGTSVSNATATLVGLTWRFVGTTWGPANGILGNWTIDFTLNQIGRGAWKVVGSWVGPYGVELEAAYLRPGVWLNNTYNTAYQFGAVNETATGWNLLALELGTLIALYNRTNYDGSVWQACYPEADWPSGPPSAVNQSIQHLVDGGHGAYANMTDKNRGPGATCNSEWNPSSSNWTFYVVDPDCILEIHVFQPDDYLVPQLELRPKVYGGNDVIIKSSAAYNAYVQTGAYNNLSKFGEAEVARALMGHEFFHAIQLAMAGGQLPWSASEGTAILATTLDAPQFEQDSTSFWHYYGNNYASGTWSNTSAHPLDTDPDLKHAHSLCHAEANLYSSGALWSVLYALDGGLEFLKHYIDHARDLLTDCPSEFDDAIQRALQNQTDASHSTLDEVLEELGERLYNKTLRWEAGADRSDYDWFANFTDVARTPQLAVNSSHLLRGYSMRYIEPVATGSFNVTFWAESQGWSSRAIVRDCENTVTLVALPRGTVVHLNLGACAEAEVLLNVIRTGKDTQSFWIDLVD